MALSRIGTRGILIAASVVYVGAGAVVAHIACAPSAVLSSRHGLHAALVMPADLRSFPVEHYLGSEDNCAYAMFIRRPGRKRWSLSIDTTLPRRHWQDALGRHANARGFRRVGRRQTTESRLYMAFGADGRRIFVVEMNGEPAGPTHITLTYYPKLKGNRQAGPRGWIRNVACRIKRCLFGPNRAPNATTRAS